MRPIPAFAIADSLVLPLPPEPPMTHADLRRPRLLMAAARHGIGDYRRARDLMRLLGCCPASAAAVAELTELEAHAEDARRSGNPSWSCTRHVEVLIAPMAERAVFGGSAAPAP